jgi:hypothetical protein
MMFAPFVSPIRTFAAALALAVAGLPGLAAAQSAPPPSYAQLPSYAKPAPVHETLGGTISNFDGKYGLFVRDDRGFVDNITLRDGTIINPTGLRLAEGMRVTVTGFTQGKTFVALQIDTPYNTTYALPAPAPAYAYGYPYYGGAYYGAAYPWYYPAAAFGIGFAFGAYPYWGPYGYGGYYGYRGGYYGYRGYYGGGYYGGYHGGYYGGGYHNPANPNGGYHGGGYGGSYGGSAHYGGGGGHR